jgi:hypothetical protein
VVVAGKKDLENSVASGRFSGDDAAVVWGWGWGGGANSGSTGGGDDGGGAKKVLPKWFQACVADAIKGMLQVH